MKNKILVIASCVLFSIASCTKGGNSTTWKCTCVVGNGGGVTGVPFKDTTFYYNYGSVAKTTAQYRCDSQRTYMEHTYGMSTAFNGYQGAACNLQ